MTLRALLIDLDDTLYSERHYVLSGFRVVSGAIASRFSLEQDHVFTKMVDVLDQQGRGKIFDQTLQAFGATANASFIDDLVHIYRTHAPNISFYGGVERALNNLSKSFKLAVVTDGLPAVQRRKVEALAIQTWTDTIIYCWALNAPKPETDGFVLAARQLGVPIADCAIIGDNLSHDGVAAKNLSIPYYRCNTGRFAAQKVTGVVAENGSGQRFESVADSLCSNNP